MFSAFKLRRIALNLIRSSNSRPLSEMKATAKLSGKVALVTASTEGIGFAIAKRLAEDGASVVISSRKQDKVEKRVKQLQDSGLDVVGTVCHVGNQEQRNKLVDFALEQKGGIDIFVSNAAVSPAMGMTLECSEAAWDKIFDINLKSAFLLTKLIVPQMEKKGGGSIVYISSIGGYQPLQLIGAYSVSKTALLGLTKALAIECAPMKIRVNCVCPGIIQTQFSRPFWENEAFLEMIKQVVPMRRIGQPEEIASLVSFLSSDDASYLTGESIPVAGGFYSRL
ncbi:Dehydrogenase/reductase SDR family member 4-like protein [Dinothrombium tinctorium]|uniref:Dehydrogenase/reductase SDR family member 4-like protein n=1 Tax=Dinothrombium tinctorium TaxID=1965070 RepID=A0A3S3P5V5_9ACAR|nr:Dehydrogenase/reductase SDR family member 4-like protein [Dinothrombium tinctorium]RWS12790.1 Dehydrogenase/reductase SDR family member 4-like protein [Dinothrombium tinctorium]RWS16773.1 Dehydrogenase/reductase SDR family member 4-like protein [Dinothrombium tinctorium]